MVYARPEFKLALLLALAVRLLPVCSVRIVARLISGIAAVRVVVVIRGRGVAALCVLLLAGLAGLIVCVFAIAAFGVLLPVGSAACPRVRGEKVVTFGPSIG